MLLDLHGCEESLQTLCTPTGKMQRSVMRTLGYERTLTGRCFILFLDNSHTLHKGQPPKQRQRSTATGLQGGSGRASTGSSRCHRERRHVQGSLSQEPHIGSCGAGNV